MTAWDKAKDQGTTLKEISIKSGVSLQTLDNWYKHKNKLFNIVVKGCKEWN